MKEKFSNARVAVAGLEGLGSNMAVMLAKVDRTFAFSDFDTVDVTEFKPSDVYDPHLGRPKAEALPDTLPDQSTYLNMSLFVLKVTQENVKGCLEMYPIVTGSHDKPDQKAMLVRELLGQCPETMVVSGNGMAGLGDTNDIQTRKMMRRLYVCGDQKTDVGNGIGLIAPRVAACAAHQANKVLQLILQS